MVRRGYTFLEWIGNNKIGQMKIWHLIVILINLNVGLYAQQVLLPEHHDARQTYCNPIDIDYTYMSHNRARKAVSYRSGADPAVVLYKDKYYMFVTRSLGYWMSDDLLNWTFVLPVNWYFEGCNAPGAAVYKDKLLLYGSPYGYGAMLESTAPEKGLWKSNYAVINVPGGIQDPDIFVDDDNRVYLFEESSNLHPIRMIELDPDHFFIPIGEEKDLFHLNPELHGWERFGQDHNSEMAPFIEGPWMLKHGGRYYLEYGAPGTQWNVYADGVYISDHPGGPFHYAEYNPICYKPGGFLNGSGHGSTLRTKDSLYWHFATMAISVNYKFERRLGMYPAGFDETSGQMWVNTAYGDYPHTAPEINVPDHKNRFKGWMLLSYNKPVRTNANPVDLEVNVIDESESGYMLEQIQDFSIHSINDEEIRSYWVSDRNAEDIYVELDLLRPMELHAVQINFQDFRSEHFGRLDTLHQQFRISTSLDGETWSLVVDYSENTEDRPHAYLELREPIQARYVRYEHVHCTNRYLAISEFRVFGYGGDQRPASPKHISIARDEDRRDAQLSWDAVDDAMGYVIRWGLAPDQMNLSYQIYNQTSHTIRALNTFSQYYFSVEAFNENGISVNNEIFHVE